MKIRFGRPILLQKNSENADYIKVLKNKTENYDILFDEIKVNNFFKKAEDIFNISEKEYDELSKSMFKIPEEYFFRYTYIFDYLLSLTDEERKILLVESNNVSYDSGFDSVIISKQIIDYYYAIINETTEIIVDKYSKDLEKIGSCLQDKSIYYNLQNKILTKFDFIKSNSEFCKLFMDIVSNIENDLYNSCIDLAAKLSRYDDCFYQGYKNKNYIKYLDNKALQKRIPSRTRNVK